MSKSSIVMVLILILTPLTLSQISQYPLAPEVWSDPEIVYDCNGDILFGARPSLTRDGKTMYFTYAGNIQASHLSDSGWTVPVNLNSNINTGAQLRNCVVSYDGKTLYWANYNAGLTMFYSNWDSTMNDWGNPIFANQDINSDGCGAIPYCCPNDTSIFFSKCGSAYICNWDSTINDWGPKRLFPTEYGGFHSDDGLFTSENYDKVYIATSIKKPGRNYTSDYDVDITVSYKNLYYIPEHRLHFSLLSDSLYLSSQIEKRSEGAMTLTQDKKTMYFNANYDLSQGSIYKSILLYDSLTSVKNELEAESDLPKEFTLNNPYPNPFNSNITISCEVKQPHYYSLLIFNSIGEQVKKIYDGYLQSGTEEFNISFSEYSSGVYFILFTNGLKSEVKKLIYQK